MKDNVECGWCGTITTKTYKLSDGKYLCLKCANKHYSIIEDKMNRLIENIKSWLGNKRDKLEEILVDSCDHTEFTRTGYCVRRDDKMMEICRCNNCGKQLYKNLVNLCEDGR